MLDQNTENREPSFILPERPKERTGKDREVESRKLEAVQCHAYGDAWASNFLFHYVAHVHSPACLLGTFARRLDVANYKAYQCLGPCTRQKMICARYVFRCFKSLERLGDRVTGAAGPFFVGFAMILLSTGTLCFCVSLSIPCNPPYCTADT